MSSRRWSLYTYAYNDPIRFNDPDGMQVYVGENNSENKDLPFHGGDPHLDPNKNDDYDPFNEARKRSGMNYISDSVHDKSSSRVYWDPNVHSFDDIKGNSDLEYWGDGSDGKTYNAQGGGTVQLCTNGYVNPTDLNPNTIGKNLFGSSYPGEITPNLTMENIITVMFLFFNQNILL